MADRQGRPPERGPIAFHFDVMTMALAVIMLCVAACSVVAVGPAESLDRLTSAMGSVIDGFTARQTR